MARNLRIFIAEDSAHVLSALSSLLQSIEGVEIIGHASEAPAALDSIRSARPDVAILDLQMARGSGMDVLRGLQADGVNQPVRIVFTNQTEPRWRTACTALGADYFFNKAADGARLADTVRSMLHSG